jgi:hypothetical protein
MSYTRLCKGCAQPIHGAYLTALNADWHPEHFCCVVCEQPVTDDSFYVHDTQPCHQRCYETTLAPRCTICNKALLGKHQRNEWGERFCSDHAKELAACSYCGRFVPHVTKRMRRRSIEDIRCAICATTAIESVEQAKLHLPALVDWVEAQGVHFRQKRFRIEVLDRAAFNTREGGRRDPLGLTTSTRYLRNKQVDHARVESVAILQGLPRTLFAGVCVHELGHVWLVQHNIVNLPLIDEEGFCELLAYRWYTETPLTIAPDEAASSPNAGPFYARRIAENPNPVYGDGFRKVQRLADRVGFAQIIKSLLRKKKLPL